MKPTTRDNLIYLTVGLTIAGLLAADVFYADSHGTKAWMPSRFAFRAATTPSLLAYLIVRQMRQERAKLPRIAAAVLLATMLQLGIMFACRQMIDQLPGFTYSAIAVVEIFLVWQAVAWLLPYLVPGKPGRGNA